MGASPGDSKPGASEAKSECGRIAQLVEQLTLNQRVLGSSPSASTTFPLFFNQILGSPDRAIESIFVLSSSLGSSALIRHCGYSASAHQRSR